MAICGYSALGHLATYFRTAAVAEPYGCQDEGYVLGPAMGIYRDGYGWVSLSPKYRKLLRGNSGFSRRVFFARPSDFVAKDGGNPASAGRRMVLPRGIASGARIPSPHSRLFRGSPLRRAWLFRLEFPHFFELSRFSSGIEGRLTGRARDDSISHYGRKFVAGRSLAGTRMRVFL